MKAAVICSKGFGDGLMMMVASERLSSRGYLVTTYQDSLSQMQEWFPSHTFKKRSSLITLEQTLCLYDLIILQNDNSQLSFQIIDLYKKGKLNNLSVFYASHIPSKNPPLTSWDRVFDPSLPMVSNIAQAIASVLQCTQISKNNGLIIPNNLSYKKYPKRVVIHATSSTPKRTWSIKKFLKVASELKKKGFEVVFCMSPKEREESADLIKNDFELPLFPSLSALASFLFESGFLIGNESGTGHLASNLNIPTLIIASSLKQITLWRPGWLLGKVLTPSPLIPNLKAFRLREKKWQSFISAKKVLSTFHMMEKS